MKKRVYYTKNKKKTKEAGRKIVSSSTVNFKRILYNSKSRLNVYQLSCHFGCQHNGQTKNHEDDSMVENGELSGAREHTRSYLQQFPWLHLRTLTKFRKN